MDQDEWTANQYASSALLSVEDGAQDMTYSPFLLNLTDSPETFSDHSYSYINDDDMQFYNVEIVGAFGLGPRWIIALTDTEPVSSLVREVRAQSSLYTPYHPGKSFIPPNADITLYYGSHDGIELGETEILRDVVPDPMFTTIYASYEPIPQIDHHSSQNGELSSRMMALGSYH